MLLSHSMNRGHLSQYAAVIIIATKLETKTVLRHKGWEICSRVKRIGWKLVNRFALCSLFPSSVLGQFWGWFFFFCSLVAAAMTVWHLRGLTERFPFAVHKKKLSFGPLTLN